ncbi:unnamed protein product [Vitrella brassicaformis CCMP3155]|uniref:Uncharacterized protein n=1 Tax=Vitrella brassicaformis (strain CCMP3155) TaxID=1169540 RepID=A0A0G4GEC5_VITBC|nr:unnamed protein product [Vitrella brassicaformis CCMP3155]|eukprot:CEM27740.1 unnamed protein product [Vitrella brassicaformis CCMP3155]
MCGRGERLRLAGEVSTVAKRTNPASTLFGSQLSLPTLRAMRALIQRSPASGGELYFQLQQDQTRFTRYVKTAVSALTEYNLKIERYHAMAKPWPSPSPWRFPVSC